MTNLTTTLVLTAPQLETLMDALDRAKVPTLQTLEYAPEGSEDQQEAQDFYARLHELETLVERTEPDFSELALPEPTEEQNEYRLGSAPLFNTPGMMRAWVHAARTGMPKWAEACLRGGWPMLPSWARTKLLAGQYSIDGEAVVVTR